MTVLTLVVLPFREPSSAMPFCRMPNLIVLTFRESFLVVLIYRELAFAMLTFRG